MHRRIFSGPIPVLSLKNNNSDFNSLHHLPIGTPELGQNNHHAQSSSQMQLIHKPQTGHDGNLRFMPMIDSKNDHFRK